LTESTLFPDLAPSTEEQARILDLEIELLLYGKPGGPLLLTLSNEEKDVLIAIRYHRGSGPRHHHPRDAETASCNWLTDRQIKKAVRTLRIIFVCPSDRASKGTRAVTSSCSPRKTTPSCAARSLTRSARNWKSSSR